MPVSSVSVPGVPGRGNREFWRPEIYPLVMTNIAIEHYHLAVGQNLVPLVNIKIAGKWMFFPLKMVLIGIDS